MIATPPVDRQGTDAAWIDRQVGSPCPWCGRNFTEAEPYWTWSFPDLQIFMHQECFVDWLPRVMRDFYEATRRPGKIAK